MEVLNTGVDKYNRLSNKHISRLEIVVLNLVKDNRVNDFDALKKLVFARCRSGTKDGLWSSGRTSGVFFSVFSGFSLQSTTAPPSVQARQRYLTRRDNVYLNSCKTKF